MEGVVTSRRMLGQHERHVEVQLSSGVEPCSDQDWRGQCQAPLVEDSPKDGVGG